MGHRLRSKPLPGILWYLQIFNEIWEAIIFPVFFHSENLCRPFRKSMSSVTFLGGKTTRCRLYIYIYIYIYVEFSLSAACASAYPSVLPGNPVARISGNPVAHCSGNPVAQFLSLCFWVGLASNLLIRIWVMDSPSLRIPHIREGVLVSELVLLRIDWCAAEWWIIHRWWYLTYEKEYLYLITHRSFREIQWPAFRGIQWPTVREVQWPRIWQLVFPSCWWNLVYAQGTRTHTHHACYSYIYIYIYST